MPRSLKKGPFVDDHLQKKVDVQNENGTFTFERTDDGWTGRFGKVAPGAPFEGFKPSKVDDLLRAYKNLNASDFGKEQGAEDVGLDKPLATITAEGFDRVTDSEVADRFRALVDSMSVPDSTTATGAAPSITRSTAR